MNTPIRELDIARGLTVMLMPSIHTVMLYSQINIRQTALGYILIFFAEGPGAQLFMFIMGFLIAISKPKTCRQVLLRSFVLILSGYLLNFCRAYLPAKLGLFPTEMVAAYGADNATQPFLTFLLSGDILQFAGISYGVLSLIRKVKAGWLVTLLLFTGIAITTPFLWGYQVHHLYTDYLLGLFCANDSRSFFPVFPWLCYPAAGLLSGFYFKNAKRVTYYKHAGSAGLLFILAGIVIANYQPASWEGDFYRSSPARTLAQTGFVILWLAILHYLVPYLPKIISRVLTFCSQRITAIYLIQWVVIGWGTAIAGYQQLGMTETLLSIVVINLITYGITWCIDKLSHKKSSALL